MWICACEADKNGYLVVWTPYANVVLGEERIASSVAATMCAAQMLEQETFYQSGCRKSPVIRPTTRR